MNSKQSIDFLVEQTSQQAALDGVPLSDLEKRMMYFTESEDAVEDPITLNEEFEAEHNTPEFEVKISRLLQRAHDRLKKQNSSAVLQWDEAVRRLDQGDYYVLILLQDTRPFFRRHLYTTLSIFVVVGALLFGWFRVATQTK